MDQGMEITLTKAVVSEYRVNEKTKDQYCEFQGDFGKFKITVPMEVKNLAGYTSADRQDYKLIVEGFVYQGSQVIRAKSLENGKNKA